MNILTTINSYIKYVYILLGIILLVYLIKVLLALGKIGQASLPIVTNGEKIVNQIDLLNKKSEQIEHTLNTSIPFFKNIALLLVLINSISKDFYETRRSKRSVKKSINKIIKTQKKIDPNFSIAKLSKAILNH